MTLHLDVRYGLVLLLIALAVVLPLLEGCGWRLRGSYDFPAVMERVNLKGAARYSQLGIVIHGAFASTNSKLVDSPEQATAILHILAETSDKRTLATDSSGRASEYEISYQIRFKIVDAAGLELVSAQEINTSREYKFDPSHVLATGSEVERLQKDMIRISVQQMMYRINAHMRSIRRQEGNH